MSNLLDHKYYSFSLVYHDGAILEVKALLTAQGWLLLIDSLQLLGSLAVVPLNTVFVPKLVRDLWTC